MRRFDAFHRNIIDTFLLINKVTSVLTPKRLALLKSLRPHGPLSIRALSKQLERDYKNVHTQVLFQQRRSVFSSKHQETLTIT